MTKAEFASMWGFCHAIGASVAVHYEAWGWLTFCTLNVIDYWISKVLHEDKE